MRFHWIMFTKQLPWKVILIVFPPGPGLSFNDDLCWICKYCVFRRWETLVTTLYFIMCLVLVLQQGNQCRKTPFINTKYQQYCDWKQYVTFWSVMTVIDFCFFLKQIVDFRMGLLLKNKKTIMIKKL